jgi:chemotaxis protein MotB
MLIGRTSTARRSEPHAGEGYLASSADLMIGILFIFIIMVVYLAVEIKRVQADNNSRSTDPVRSLVDEVGRRLLSNGVRAELDPDSGVISLPSDALFDSGRAVPKKEALEAITKTDAVLREILPCYVTSAPRGNRNCNQLNQRGVELETVMIEGHTDSDQYANDPTRNWHLGLDRARYIFEELGKGDLGRFKNKKGQPILGVSSYADSRPSKFSASPSDPKAKDRRVELRFILSYQADDEKGPTSAVTDALYRR